MSVQVLVPSPTEDAALDASMLEIRSKLIDYLAEESSLADFLEWYEPVSWELSAQGANGDFVGSLDLLIAEYDRGHRTEDDLRARWKDIVRTTVVATGPSVGASVRLNATTKTVEGALKAAGKELAAAAS